MSDYAAVRLERSGVVVAYLAPASRVEFPTANEVREAPRVGGDRSAIVRDRQIYSSEAHVNFRFLSTLELPDDHAVALRTLFGTSQVTPEQQANRLAYYSQILGGSLTLIHRGRSYSATTDAAVNLQAGTFPAVVVSQIKEQWDAGKDACDMFLLLKVGVPRP